MIGFVKGVLSDFEKDCVIIDRDGIGFRIFVPSNLLGGQLNKGEELKLFTYLSVKEDSLSLYGFLRKDELETFRLLIGVNGIGPKAALGILSFLTVDELRMAVFTEDTAKLSKSPGIGKKTAAKLILELKDKWDIEDFLTGSVEAADVIPVRDTDNFAINEAVEALAALGYGKSEALKAVKRAAAENEAADTETLLKAALKHIF